MTMDQQSKPKFLTMLQLRSKWWTVILAVSLCANLLVAGIVIGHRVWGGPPDRAGYMQLLPRKFFADLPRARRHELMSVLKDSMESMRGLREQADITSLKIADALEKQPYDPALIQQAVTDFATGSQGLAAKGSALVTDIVTKLTPEERAQLAAVIRERDQQRKMRK
jgi:Heavy-metal resistance